MKCDFSKNNKRISGFINTLSRKKVSNSWLSVRLYLTKADKYSIILIYVKGEWCACISVVSDFSSILF